MNKYLVEFENDWDTNNTTVFINGFSFADAYWKAVEFAETYYLEISDFYRG